MDYIKLFDRLFPDFFNEESVKSLPIEQVYVEMLMELDDKPHGRPIAVPKGISFSEYDKAHSALLKAVGRVDKEWVQYFDTDSRCFCAFDGENIAAFCILSDIGSVDGRKIGGHGCVGTLPEYRRQGIGSEMVRRAGDILRDEGYALSWIHHTHLERWYAALGYKTVVRWNCKGIIQ